MQSFVDKVVVVTGAGSGMGRAYALAFASLGAKLALNDSSAAGLEATERLLHAKGLGASRVYSQQFDVADRSAMEDFAAQVQTRLGAAHVVINNAGVSGKGVQLHKLAPDEIERVMAINFGGVLHGTQAFLPQLLSQSEAALVNVSSIFGLVGAPGNSAYCASKFAVRGLTEALMVELAATPVQVHLVHPGGVNTGIADDSPQGRAFAARYLKTPPEAVAEAVVRGIRRKQLRIVCGHRARQTWLLSWAVPLGWRTRLLAKQARALLQKRTP